MHIPGPIMWMGADEKSGGQHTVGMIFARSPAMNVYQYAAPPPPSLPSVRHVAGQDGVVLQVLMPKIG